MKSKDSIVPGGVDEYISSFPEEVLKRHSKYTDDEETEIDAPGCSFPNI